MLKDIITSEVRTKIILELYKNLHTPLHIRELARRVGTEINAVRRELDRLQKCGMLKKEPKTNKIFYSVRTDYSSFSEILSFVNKEVGLGGLIVKNLAELGKVKFALLSTEFAQGRIATPNEVDLLLVGAVDIKYLQELVKKSEKDLGHEINYTVLGEDEFDFKKARRDPFILNILLQGRVVLVGDESKFCLVK
ncbi:MAG: winged helix-turn-helix domain-containing protein [Patescibacteria group bacterium]|nr:winged helix-turn-helix domain-containing protein [Patescibacteria group bacterium]